MAENRLEVQIVLDDGSIQKGFVKLEQQAEKSSKKIGQSIDENIGDKFKNALKSGNLTDIAAAFFLGGKAVTAFGAALSAVQKGVETVLDGEKLLKINKQFEILTQQAGVSASVLQESFKQAADGLVDDSDLIKVANRALIELGGSADKLPKIFELARKSAAVFGGDATENFEKLNLAIASGQTRQLKSIGVVIDAEQVYKDYAKSINRTAQELTQFERQQALVNALIEKSNTQFGNVTPSTGKASDAFTRLSVSARNLLESIQILLSKSLGSTFATSADTATKGVDRFNSALQSAFGSGQDQRTARIKLLKSELEFFERKLKSPFEGGTFEPKQETLRKINNITNELKELERVSSVLGGKSFEVIASDDAQKAAARAGIVSDAVKQANARIDEENKLALERQKKFNEEQKQISLQLVADLAKAEEQALTNNIASAQRKYEADQSQASLDNLINLQKAQEKERFEAEILALEQKYQNVKGTNQDIYNQLVEQKTQEHEDRLTQISAQETDKRNKLLLSLNQAAQNSLNQVFVQGFQNIGAALVKGGSAFANFGQFVLNILGDLAIQMGSIIIAQSEALKALAAALTNPLTGAPLAFAAGAALVVLGGALKALAGGSGGSTSLTGGGVAGGSLTTPTEATPIADIEDNQQQRETATKIEVNIAGDVLDSDETGLRIVNIINDAIGRQGAVITERVS
jgi:hypothetical protein